VRVHHDYPLLQLWSAQADARAIMQPHYLALARFDPVVAGAVTGGALLDLIFCDGKAIAVIPYIQVVPQLLIERERTPLIWPHVARALGYERIDELESMLLPWLEALTLARQANEELIRPFSDALPHELFERARTNGFLGAARYACTMAAFAPYLYAARFSKDRSVGIRDAHGANGAVMLSMRSNTLRADLLSAERNALARRWFGVDIFGELDGLSELSIRSESGSVCISLAGSAEEVRKIPIASPVPSDVIVSFDLDDSPPAGEFEVRAAVDLRPRDCPPLAVPSASGGSSGTILMLLREDFFRAPDADVDEAQAMADRLRAEGFTVEVRAASAAASDFNADLIHVFGLRSDATLVQTLQQFAERGLPIVATPNLARSPHEAEWGPQVLRAIFGRATDESWLAEYFDLLELRKVETAQPIHASLAEVSRLVDVALVSNAAEEAQLRDLCFRGEAVHSSPAIAPRKSDPSTIAPVAGTAPFVFVHAPVEWRTNVPLLVRAAAPRGIPVVVAGDAIDIDCLRAAQTFAPELVIHIPRPSAGEIEALYRTAQVYADVSWGPRGTARIARAAASGCALLLSDALPSVHFWPSAARADAASIKSLSVALERAWNTPEPRVPADANAAFSAAILAYSRAQQRRVPA
jgi:hypothetical protein